MNDTVLRIALRRRNAAIAAANSLVEQLGIQRREGLLTRVRSTAWAYGFYIVVGGVSKKAETTLVEDLQDVFPGAVIQVHRATKEAERALSVSL